MEELKQELKKYLDNKISLSELNNYFTENVAFNTDIDGLEDLRFYADITVEGKLSEQDKADEMLSEKELKEQIEKFLR